MAIALSALFGPYVRAQLDVSAPAAYVVALGFAVLLLISVLAHEAAHALAGKYYKYKVTRIVADFWGGHTAFQNTDPRPGPAAVVAVVGPLANALLALLGWLMLGVTSSDVGLLLVTAFTFSNAFVAAFNLLPGLPLDGGSLVDALVWKITGRRSTGLLAAGWGGRLVTLAIVIVMIVLPAIRGTGPSMVTAIWTGLIGAFLWTGAGQAIHNAKVLDRLSRTRLRSVLQPVQVVPHDAPVAALADLAPGVTTLVLHGERPIGTAVPNALSLLPADQWASTPVTSVMQVGPPGWEVVADPDDDLTAAVTAMQRLGLPELVIRSRGGELVGVIRGHQL